MLFPEAESVLPSPEDIRPVSALRTALRRIDGWGPLAWKELLGGWQLSPHAVLTFSLPELDVDGDADERVCFLVVKHGLGEPTDAGDAIAMADWMNRELNATLFAQPAIRAWSLRPGQAVRASNACWFADGLLMVRMQVELPYAGMGIDPARVARFVTQVARIAADLATLRSRPRLQAHRRSLHRQRLMRAALPAHGLVAFIGDGAVLPRNANGFLLPGANPINVPGALRMSLAIGRHGTIHGWGIRSGVTAIAGAPYHGKSTVLQALQSGIDDHPPGDGRELVVSDPSALLVQAEDGRAIKDTDLSGFFATLPGADPRDFSTSRASGATSMAASVVQGIAAGCRLLLIDEDTAASNFLLIDPVMRRLLGPTLRGTTTLLEALPAFAAAGISTVLVAGSSGHSLAVADQVVQMDHWQPRDATTRARRLVGRAATSVASVLPQRQLIDSVDALFGPRHFAPVDLREPERPRIKVPARTTGPDLWYQLDLRRCGWILDEALVAGALQAAGWICRLAGGHADFADLAAAYGHLTEPGAIALDPFHGRILTVPPWQLVVSVLERLPHPEIHSYSKRMVAQPPN